MLNTLVYLPVTSKRACVSVHVCSICYDLEGASSKLIMLDSGCCAPPVDGAPPLCDNEDEEVEEREAPTGPPAALDVEEGSRPPGRSGCVSVLTSSSSSSSSSSMLGQADWSSTRFSRSFSALRASCLEEEGTTRINPGGKYRCASTELSSNASVASQCSNKCMKHVM